MQQSSIRDIIAVGGKAQCPICKSLLPGRYPTGSSAHGIVLKCRACRRSMKLNIVAASSQVNPAPTDSE